MDSILGVNSDSMPGANPDSPEVEVVETLEVLVEGLVSY